MLIIGATLSKLPVLPAYPLPVLDCIITEYSKPPAQFLPPGYVEVLFVLRQNLTLQPRLTEVSLCYPG